MNDSVWLCFQTHCVVFNIWTKDMFQAKSCCSSLKQTAVVCHIRITTQYVLNSVAWVRERTIPTERPPLVSEVSANLCGCRVPRGQRDGSTSYLYILTNWMGNVLVEKLLVAQLAKKPDLSFIQSEHAIPSRFLSYETWRRVIHFKLIIKFLSNLLSPSSG
jgi:hypothetical protein